ncbi:hypothetical protein [Erwinia mallotivora]|uniref:hypothetical protein n=1 Tax=Erwinia mallotivora TaxID=69222 RepID=UPI0021BF3E13|nr:hypothetical protein [Erwinia mallotivora]
MQLIRKKGFTISRFTVFGVTQFAFYMGMFAVRYLCDQATLSNPEWRIWGLVAFFCGLVVSFTPWLIHEQDSLIMPFMNVVAPVAFYLFFATIYCFYKWTVPSADDLLIVFANCYLLGTVAVSVLMLLENLSAARR